MTICCEVINVLILYHALAKTIITEIVRIIKVIKSRICHEKEYALVFLLQVREIKQPCSVPRLREIYF
jgi:hypothetical protein